MVNGKDDQPDLRYIHTDATIKDILFYDLSAGAVLVCETIRVGKGIGFEFHARVVGKGRKAKLDAKWKGVDYGGRG